MKPDQTICCLLLIAGMALALCTRVQAQQLPSKDSVTTAVSYRTAFLEAMKGKLMTGGGK